MRGLLRAILLALTCVVSSAFARSAYGDRLLVVLDSELRNDAYSKLWTSLRGGQPGEDRGFSLTFRTQSSGPELFEFGEPAYDHAILFVNSAKSLTSDLSPQSLLRFMSFSEDKPHNILFALGSTAVEAWRDLAREFSIDFDARGTALIDHVHYDPSIDTDGSHSAIRIPLNATSVPASGSVLSPETLSSGPVAFRGVAQSLPPRFPLAHAVLSAPSTAYSYDKSDGSSNAAAVDADLDGSGGPYVSGSSAALVTAFQTLTGSRAIWSGSIDLFSDAFSTSETGNEAFVRDVTRWAFQELHVLRTGEVAHNRIGEREAREQYRVGDEFVYSITISQWKDDAWRAVSLSDLQLEITMLDPHLRVPLVATTGGHMHSQSTRYSARVKLPDRHGVFALIVDHRRAGSAWTYVNVRDQISITPLRHDEYPRFIQGAWPWYAGAISSMAAWLVFVVAWLSLDPQDKPKSQ